MGNWLQVNGEYNLTHSLLPITYSLSLKNRLDQFLNAPLHVGIVGDRPRHGRLAGADWRHALPDQVAGIDQESGTAPLFQSVVPQVPYLLAQLHQLLSHIFIRTRLMLDHLGFNLTRRIAELDGHEALLGALLQIFEDALVAGIVRDDQHELIDRLDYLPLLFNRQQASVVAQRMNDHGSIFPGLDDLVEIDDASVLDAECQRPIYPDRLLPLQEVSTHEIGGREVLVAGDGDEGALQPVGHVLHEARLPAAGRPLQHDRHPALSGNREESDFAVHLGV